MRAAGQIFHRRYRAQQNGGGVTFATRVDLDIAGRERSTTDALGRRTAACAYDLRGARLYHAGMDGAKISEILSRFTGTHRRMTLKGEIGGVTVVDDYALNPPHVC